MADFKFEDLASLTDREIQTLLREVDQKDLVVALKGASQDVIGKTMGNMSKRVQTFILEEIEFLGPIENSEIEGVQNRVVQLVDSLIDRGQISLPGAGEKSVVQNPSQGEDKSYQALKACAKKTASKPLEQLSYDELNTLFKQLGEIARGEGILALQDVIPEQNNPFLGSSLTLIVDGTEPALIMDILEKWMESLLHEQKRKYQKIIEGAMAVQAGDNPSIIEHKLSVIY